MEPRAHFPKLVNMGNAGPAKPTVANKSADTQQSLMAATRSTNKSRTEVGVGSVGKNVGSKERLSGSAAAASGLGGRSQNSIASLDPTVLKSNQLISRMQARKKHNDQGPAASQYTLNTVDGSNIESVGAAEPDVMNSAETVAKAMGVHQGEAAQRQEVEDQPAGPTTTAAKHPAYAQLQEMLDEFMTHGDHDNSATIINNSIYRDNVRIRSRAMNLLHTTSKSLARGRAASPRSLRGGGIGGNRTIGDPSRWSLPASLDQTGIHAAVDGYGAGRVQPKVKTPKTEDKIPKATPDETHVPRVVNAAAKSALRQGVFASEGTNDVLEHSPSLGSLNPADIVKNQASRPSRDDRRESLFPDTYADARTLECQLFSTASELYDAGTPLRTLQQIIQQNDKQPPMDSTSKTVVSILKHEHLKTDRNIKVVQQYFVDFDFMKKDASQKKNHQLTHAQSEAADKGGGAEPMIKDQNTLNQMLRVMELLVVPANCMVFDYMSQGDQFYMVLHGQVDCKVPFENQYVLMSKYERSLFVQEYKDDIVKIKEANSINKQLSSFPPGLQKANQALMYDQLKLQMLQNPYDLSQVELMEHIDNLLYVEKSKIILEHRRIAESNATESAQEHEQGEPNGLPMSIETSKRPSVYSPTAAKAPSDCSHDDAEFERPILRGKAITDEELLLLREDVRLQRLLQACDTLLQNHKTQSERKFYQLSILKRVKTYGPCTSFGELALLTNKRRKAKLQVRPDGDAYFAVLSKKDYKNAIYKVQNQILQQKMDMLRSVALFSTLSNAQLNLISYGMQYRACSRGQVIYKEGDLRPDMVYLIKDGEFQCLKKVLKPECEHQKKLEELPIGQNEVQGPKQEQERKVLLMKRTELLQNYNQTYQKSKTEQHEICIHSDSDVFGYQELLQEGTRTRSHTVICQSAEGVLIEIHKSHLDNMMRKVAKNLEPMIEKFEELVQIRIQNKIITSCEFKKELLRQKSKSGHWDKRGGQKFSGLLKSKSSATATPAPQQSKESSPLKLNLKLQDDAHVSTKLVNSTTGIIERARMTLTEQANRAPGKLVRKDHDFEQIPAAQQSYVDKNFSYFKNSLHSSVTIPELNTIKKFEKKLEQKIHRCKVYPESAAQSKDKLLLSQIQKRVRLKQHLYVPARSSSPEAILLPLLPNADMRGIVHQSAELKTFHIDRGEDSSYHYHPEGSVFQANRGNDASDKLDGQFQNKMLSDIQVPNAKVNDFQKKTHSVGNLYERQSDWGKELSIVESKCFKFLTSQSNLDLEDPGDRHFQTHSHLEQRHTSAATWTLLNESAPRSLYSKQYSQIQQSIQKSISHSDYDFVKDIEQLKETKQKQYLGALSKAPDYDEARKRYRNTLDTKNQIAPTTKPHNLEDDIDEKYMKNPIIRMQIMNESIKQKNAASSIDIVNQEPKRRSKVNIYRGYEAKVRKSHTIQQKSKKSSRSKSEEKTLKPEVVRTVEIAEKKSESLVSSVFDQKRAQKSLTIQRIRPKVNYRQLIFDHEQFNKHTLSQEEFLRKSHNSNIEHQLTGGLGVEVAGRDPYGIEMAPKQEEIRRHGANGEAPASDAFSPITKNQSKPLLRQSASQLSRMSGSSKTSHQKQPKPQLRTGFNPQLIGSSVAITLEQSLEDDIYVATPLAQRDPSGGYESSMRVSVQSNKKKDKDAARR